MNVVSIGKRAASSIEKLSPEGLELVEAMLSDGETYATVIAALRDRTGEQISRSALSRFRRTDFEPSRQRIKTARSLALGVVDLLKDSGSIDEKFNASAQGLFDMLLPRMLEMSATDVTKLAREARMFQAVRLAQRKADMSEQKLDLDRQKLELEKRELDKKLADFEARKAAAKRTIDALLSDQQLPPEAVTKMKILYDLD